MSELGKTLGEQSGNAKAHLDEVEVYYIVKQKLMADTNKMHEVFSISLGNMVAEMGRLKEKVRTNPLQLKKFLMEKLRPVQDELLQAEEAQKTQNKASQQVMSETKRENRETAEAVSKTFEKLKYMDAKVGQYQ